MKWTQWVVILLILCLPSFGGAQVVIDSTLLRSSDVQVLQTHRGDIFFGFVELIDTDSITFLTQKDISLRVAISNINRLTPARESKWLQDATSPYDRKLRLSDDKYVIQFENLAYSFSAIPYPKGLAEYRNIDLLYNTIDVGVGEHFSLGGGMLIPLIINLRAKGTYSVNPNLHFGLGTNAFFGLGPFTEGVIVHYFGIATIGEAKRYFNVTYGRFVSSVDLEESLNLVTVGGGITFNNRWRVYADIGIGTENTGVIPAVVASWSHRRNRIEAGVLGVWDGFLESIPILSYAHRF